MFSTLIKHPPRSPIASSSTITLTSSPHGPMTMSFIAPSDTNKEQWVMRLTIPPNPSVAIPPPHIHRFQTETFTVQSGRMLAVATHVPGGQKVLSAGESVSIPPYIVHRFENAGPTPAAGVKAQEGSEDYLVVDLLMSPKRQGQLGDEAFFRNFYTYVDDCGRAGMAPNPLQVMTFLWDADTIVKIPYVPIFVTMALEWVLAAVGKWIFGLKSCYGEYYTG